MDAKFMINDKEFSFKEVINDLHKIYLIVSDNCLYCKKNNIKSDKEKIKLIYKILKKYGFGGDKNEKSE